MIGRWIKKSDDWEKENKKKKYIGSGKKAFYSKVEDKLYKWINSQLPKKGAMTDFRHNREVVKKSCQRFEHVNELLVEADEKAKKLSPSVAFEQEQKTALLAKFKSVAQEKGKWDQICEQINFGEKSKIIWLNKLMKMLRN